MFSFSLIRTTWWIVGFVAVAIVAAMLGFGGQFPAFVTAAFLISILFGALFVAGLLLEGALHLTHTAHSH